jgi:hypothetical protein
MTHPMLTWLEAQLDDDQCVAEAAHLNPWRWNYWDADVNGDVPSWAELMSGDDVVIACEGQLVMFGTADAEHIALHDPAAVLADIAAKRAIITDHQSGSCAMCWTSPNDPPERERTYCRTVKLLATAYANRPGWDPSWAPT